MRRAVLVAILVGLTIWPVVHATAADIFGFYAPPGGIYANASFEREAVVEVSVTVEHEGVAIPDWFIAVGSGNAGTFEPRQMAQGAELLDYQIYGSVPPSTAVLKAPPEVLTVSNVITSSDFGTDVVTTELVAFTIWVLVPSGQFQPSGAYTDTVSLALYTGDYASAGTHILADTVDVDVTGRMAELLDLYADREPGIRSMDLTAAVANRLIASVHERSNSSTGYTVTITSENLAADGTGATDPFFEHDLGADRLTYTLTYSGTPVGPWSGGASIVADSGSTTAPEWLTKDLRISYSGTTTLAAGDYEDRLIITISAK